MFTVSGNEGFNGLAQLRRAFGAQAAQGLAGQNAEPNFHLIQPTGRGGGEVKMDVGMLGLEISASNVDPHMIVRLPVVDAMIQRVVELDEKWGDGWVPEFLIDRKSVV